MKEKQNKKIFAEGLKTTKARFGGLTFKKKVLVIFAAIVLLIVGVVLFQNLTKKPGYTAGKAEKGDILEVVSETGSVVGSGRIDVYSPTDGFVTSVSVKNGDAVTEGDELFKVESSATEQEQRAAYANYLAAKNAYEAAQSSLLALQSAMFGAWDTFKELAESDTYEDADGNPKHEQRALPEFHIAEKNWLAAEEKFKDQQSVISQAQASMSSTWLLYQATQDSTVKATVSGIVSNLSVSAGNSVSANSPLVPAPPVLLLSTPAAAEVVAQLGENDVLKVKAGQEADVEIDAIDSKKYKGVVARVDDIGTNLAGVVTYNVYVEIKEDDNKIRSGMDADVEIVTNRLSGVLTVPNSAVKPHEGGKAIRIPGKKKGEIEFIPVQIGVRGEKSTQILDGLEDGQTIIVSLANEEIKRSSPLGF